MRPPAFGPRGRHHGGSPARPTHLRTHLRTQVRDCVSQAINCVRSTESSYSFSRSTAGKGAGFRMVGARNYAGRVVWHAMLCNGLRSFPESPWLSRRNIAPCPPIGYVAAANQRWTKPHNPEVAGSNPAPASVTTSLGTGTYACPSFLCSGELCSGPAYCPVRFRGLHGGLAPTEPRPRRSSDG
jgi:hypothetical protein